MLQRGVLLALGLVATTILAQIAQGEDRPNIIWLTSEDNSPEWLHCYGNPHAKSPHVDRLAAEGFLYEHVYANAPVCAPMRSTWITGVLSISMGTHPMRSRYKIPHDQIRYYPDLLKEAGYYTGNDNKTDYNIGGRPDAQCWDNPGAVSWATLKNEQPFFQVINVNGSHESSAFPKSNEIKHDPSDTRLATYHPDVPGMRENYARYHDAISTMDSKLGVTLDKLQQAGLADNTIVIYNSDHGGVMPRSKRFLFRSGLQCPMIVRIPERYQSLWPADRPGTKVDRLVSFVDMPKTWLSLAGCHPPDYMQGSVFLGPEADPEPRYHFAFRGRADERYENARALCDKRYLYIRNYMPYVPWMQHLDYLWRMEATQVWERAVAEGHATDSQARYFKPKGWTEELYDIESDPDNVENLIDDPSYQEVVVKMRRNLRQRQLETYDAGLIPESEIVRLAQQHHATIYELVRNPEVYDTAALLDAADLALERNASKQTEIRRLLDNRNLGLRYWGIVGCFLLDDREGGLKAISDESHEVRAMAAWLLVRTGEKEKGIACLQEMISKDSYAILTLLNIVDWMGEDASELLPAIDELEFIESHPNEFKYHKRMQDYLLERFDH